MKILKRTMAILLVMIISFSVVSVGAEAVSVSTTDSDYGYMIPTNYNFTKAASTVYLYGNYDYINFYINSEYSGIYFFFEIYSDAAYTKPVYSDYTYCGNYGTFTYTPYINMLGKFSSKTYYAITYAAYIDDYDNVTVSESSLSSFKIVVNRLPKYNQQIVGLKSATNTVNGPSISWYKLSDSTVKYNVYRRYTNGTQWKFVGSVNGSTYNFVDKSVKNTSAGYVYTVRGVDRNGNLTRFHYAGVTCYFVETPVITSVTVQADNSIQVKWNKINSSASYYLFKKVNDGKWVALGQMYGTSFKDEGVKSGNNYKYTVRAQKSFPGYPYSDYYAGKGVDYIEAPNLNPMEFTEDGMNVSWNSVVGAKKYAIYRKSLEANSTWKILGRVDSDTTSYIDKTAVEDGAYRYTVRSEGETNQGSYKSEGVCYVNLTEPEVKVTNVYSDCLRLQWNKAEYADYYYLMCNDGSGWKTDHGTPGYVNFFYYSQNECKEYQFSVMPMVGKHHGTYKTDVDSVITFPSFHINSLVYNDYVRLSWKNIKADSYNVYRKLKDAPDTDYELLANITNTAYNDYSAEENVAYTYCIRAVYHSIEQNMNISYATITKYSADKYIKSFKVNQIVSYDKRTNTTSYDYEFEVEKTPEGKDLKTVVYALGVNGWVNVNNPYYDFRALEFATAEPIFYAVAYDSNGRTPIDGCSSLPLEELCEAPEIKLNVLKNNITVSWDAVDDAVEYSVEEKNSWIKKTVDGSINSINFNISDLRDEDLRFCISVKHSNGNVTKKTMNEVRYTTSIPAVVKVTSGANGNSVYLEGPMHYENSVYHIFRKAPGQKNWTKIGYYQGKPYVDSTAQAGVRYTYTVRLYDYVNKFYMSYYDTVGVQVGQIQTPRLIRARNYRDMTYGDGISITWDYTYDDVQCYYIYRKTANTGWKKIATTEKSWFWDITTQPGVTYYYTVRAYDGTILSGYDPVGVKCTKS